MTKPLLLTFLVLAAVATGDRSARAFALQDDATAQLLSELIRVNTSNPPGHEEQIARLLETKFKPLGFEISIVPTPEAGKASFFARLRGDGSKRPILLAAHADVVGVEPEKWSLDPFAGVIKDGHVYGRGAITRMHGNDERVSVESLRQGTEMIYNTLVDVARRP